MGHVLANLITAETKAAHRATWWVYTGEIDPATGRRERIRRQATMRGTWPGYDVDCSCGDWSSKTGGATYRSVEDDLWDHRFSAQCAANPEPDHH